MAQFSFKRHHDANILNDKHVVCTVKCWRHGCNHVVFNVKLGHAALILNRLLRLCLCLCVCSEFAKSLLSSHDRHIMVGISDLIHHWLNHFFWYGLNFVGLSEFCLGHKSWQYSVSSRISRANQIISVLLCDENVVYISSTATMNCSTPTVVPENALKLSVDEIILIQRCWGTIWNFEFILKYKLHENG